MQKTKWWALALVLLCTLFTSTGQLFLKAGVMKVTSFWTIFNWALILGIFLYATAAGLLIITLKFGELSVLYPAIATSFIWVNLLSMIFLNETIPFFRWIGIALIIFGVSLIGFGSKTMVEMRNEA